MIQDIAPIHLHNEFQYKKPKAESRMLAYGSRMIFLDNTDEKAGIRFITYEQLNAFIKKVVFLCLLVFICLRWGERIIF